MLKGYREYKETNYDWLPQVPFHWEWIYLSQSCKEQNIKNSDKKENQVLSLSYGNIIRKKDINFGLVPKEYTGYQIVDKGNIILRLTDLQNDHTSLRTGLVKEKGIITSAYTCIKPYENSAYLQYLLHSYDTRKVFYGMGGGVRQSIGFKEIRNINIPFPPVAEQDQIVRYLDWKISMINKYINAKKKQIELLKKQRQAVINETVRRGHGQKYRFRHLFTLIKGLNITKADLVDSGVPCVSYGEIHSRYGFAVNPDINALRCVEKKYLQTNPKSLMKYGDFVFADTSEDIAGSGNFTYLNSNTQAFAGYHTIIARPNKVMNYRYLAYFFDSLLFRKQIQQNVNGVKVYSITRSILNDTYILLPSTDEQLSIVAHLDEQCERIDKLVDKFNEEIMLFTEYRTRLISDVVTGKVDVQGEKVPEFEMYDQGITEKEDDE